MTAAKTRRGAAPAKAAPAAIGKRPSPKPAAAKAPVRKLAPAASRSSPSKAAAPAKSAPAKAAPAKAAPVKSLPAKAAPVKSAPAKVAAPSKPVSTRVALPAKPPSTKPGVTAKPPGKPPAAKTVVAPKASGGRKGRGDASSEANLHKRVDSERIAEHIAAFEKSGGRVEKLGVTKVLQRVTELAASAPAQASKTGGRRR